MEVEAVVVVVVACISIYSQEINANTYITSTALLVFQLALAANKNSFFKLITEILTSNLIN